MKNQESISIAERERERQRKWDANKKQILWLLLSSGFRVRRQSDFPFLEKAPNPFFLKCIYLWSISSKKRQRIAKKQATNDASYLLASYGICSEAAVGGVLLLIPLQQLLLIRPSIIISSRPFIIHILAPFFVGKMTKQYIYTCICTRIYGFSWCDQTRTMQRNSFFRSHHIVACCWSFLLSCWGRWWMKKHLHHSS